MPFCVTIYPCSGYTHIARLAARPPSSEPGFHGGPAGPDCLKVNTARLATSGLLVHVPVGWRAPDVANKRTLAAQRSAVADCGVPVGRPPAGQRGPYLPADASLRVYQSANDGLSARQERLICISCPRLKTAVLRPGGCILRPGSVAFASRRADPGRRTAQGARHLGGHARTVSDGSHFATRLLPPGPSVLGLDFRPSS